MQHDVVHSVIFMVWSKSSNCLTRSFQSKTRTLKVACVPSKNRVEFSSFVSFSTHFCLLFRHDDANMFRISVGSSALG